MRPGLVSEAALDPRQEHRQPVACVTPTPAPHVVAICDWLPPYFGAVGQHALMTARESARLGTHVTLIGLDARSSSRVVEEHGAGRLTVVRIRRRLYDKSSWRARFVWTVVTNFRLVRAATAEIRGAAEVLFVGSPPFMLYFVLLANLFWRVRLTYRITDFYPECLMAALDEVPPSLRLVYRLTCWLRRRVPRFEVLGLDQMRRLLAIGIPPERIVLKPNASPVAISGHEPPLAVPDELRGYLILLYSGTWGVPHDVETFVEGYIRHHRSGAGRVALWLNATGCGALAVEAALRQARLPVARTLPVRLQNLASLMVTPAAHLITLKSSFVGYVMPSKVHACIEAARPILYIGSAAADVHDLCLQASRLPWYRRVEPGDPAGVAAALDEIAVLCGRADEREAQDPAGRKSA